MKKGRKKEGENFASKVSDQSFCLLISHQCCYPSTGHWLKGNQICIIQANTLFCALYNLICIVTNMSYAYKSVSKMEPEMVGIEPGFARQEAAALPFEPSHFLLMTKERKKERKKK